MLANQERLTSDQGASPSLALLFVGHCDESMTFATLELKFLNGHSFQACADTKDLIICSSRLNLFKKKPYHI